MYVNNYNFSHHRVNTVDPAVCYPEAIYLWLTPFALKVTVFPDWIGSCHECDLYLLFGFPFMPKELLPKPLNNVTWYDVDRNASQLFGSFVRQFLKYSYVAYASVKFVETNSHFSDPNLPYDSTWFAHQPREHWFM
jgi:hypothetical protein